MKQKGSCWEQGSVRMKSRRTNTNMPFAGMSQTLSSGLKQYVEKAVFSGRRQVSQTNAHSEGEGRCNNHLQDFQLGCFLLPCYKFNFLWICGTPSWPKVQVLTSKQNAPSLKHDALRVSCSKAWASTCYLRKSSAEKGALPSLASLASP